MMSARNFGEAGLELLGGDVFAVCIGGLADGVGPWPFSRSQRSTAGGPAGSDDRVLPASLRGRLLLAAAGHDGGVLGRSLRFLTPQVPNAAYAASAEEISAAAVGLLEDEVQVDDCRGADPASSQTASDALDQMARRTSTSDAHVYSS